MSTPAAARQDDHAAEGVESNAADGGMVTAAERRYLKALYRLERRSEAPAATGRVARQLGVTHPSAFGMLQRLDRKGFVICRRYRGSRLTATGLAVAIDAVRIHRLLEAWLYEDLEMPWERLHAEAELLEPVVSERFIQRIGERLEAITHCPYGRPIQIPDPDGVPDVVPPSSWSLANGSRARIVEVEDSDRALLHYLEAHDLRPSVQLTVAGRDAYDGFITVQTGHALHILSRRVASAIAVSTTKG